MCIFRPAIGRGFALWCFLHRCIVSGGVSFRSFMLRWHVRKLILLAGETRGGAVYDARVCLWKFQESAENTRANGRYVQTAHWMVMMMALLTEVSHQLLIVMRCRMTLLIVKNNYFCLIRFRSASPSRGSFRFWFHLYHTDDFITLPWGEIFKLILILS